MDAAEVTRVDVLVIGGGLAGLTAAVGLRGHGLRTLVLEADEVLGGRAMSYVDERTGDPVHIGPHILLSEYPNMLALLEQCGTREKVVWQTGRFIRMVDGQRETDMTMADLPPPLHYAPSVLADPALGHADRLSNLRVSLLAARLSPEDVLRLDNVNAAAFLRSMGVTEWFIDRFWRFSAMSIMNVPLELCSAGALLRFYQGLIGHRHYQVGFPDGGLGELFAPSARRLIEAEGGEVWLGARAEQLCLDGQRVTGALLADGRKVEAGTVIAALPPHALRRLVPRPWLRRPPFRELVHFQPCPYVSTYLWFDEQLTREQFWARAFDPNDLNCDFYDFSNIYRERSLSGSLIGTNCIYSYRADGLSDEELVTETRRELAEYLPRAAKARLLHSVVHRIPMAIHCPFPGTEQRRAAMRSPIEGLWLAGDWVDTGLPSSMESACFSGWRVAEQLLAARGVHRALAHTQKDVEGLVRATHEASSWLRLPALPRWVKGTRQRRPPKGFAPGGER